MKRKLAIWLVLGAILVAHEAYFFGYTVDEAYISARYARNLREGLGLVFNAGERVEGYTNFLLVVFQATVPHLGDTAVTATKILCMISSLVALWLVLGLPRDAGGAPGPAGLLAGLLLVVNGAVAVSAVTGLETHLFCALVTGGMVAYMRGGPRRETLSAILFGLACLVRPEGFLFSAITMIHLLARKGRYSLSWACAWLAVVAPLILWRRGYYGEWVPNTFFAKTGGGLHQLGRGVGYLKSFLNEYGRIALFFLAVLPFLHGRVGWRRSYQAVLLVPYVVYVAYTGGDWIPHFRLLVPIMPLLFSLLGEGMAMISRLVLAARGGWRTARIAVLIIFLGLLLFDVANQSYYLHMGTGLWAAGYRHAHRSVAFWLRDNTPEEAGVALMDIGIISYFSRRRVIDTTGLTEPWIARSPGGWLKKEYPVARLLELEPGYVVLVSRGEIATEGFASSFPIDQRIHDDPVFQQTYEFVFSRDAFYQKKPHDFGYYLNVFRKR